MSERRKTAEDASFHFGVPISSALERRERLADDYSTDYGAERVFPELVRAVLDEVAPDSRVLEVGAATGLMTRPLLTRAGILTALEPSAGMLRRLISSDVASSDRLVTIQGMVESLVPELAWEIAVVTFTPRRGVGLLRLLLELAVRVTDTVVMMLADDGSMDWAFLARAAAVQGFDVRIRIVNGAEGRRAFVLVADVSTWEPTFAEDIGWAADAREVTVPYPSPRGAATRLVRTFMASGDRGLVIHTDPRGVEKLHGSVRTAVHRLGRGELTVRRDGALIKVVRVPPASERGSHD